MRYTENPNIPRKNEVIESWLAKGLLSYEELPSGGSGVYSFKRIRKADLDSFLDQSYHQQGYDIGKEPEKHAENKLILLPRNT